MPHPYNAHLPGDAPSPPVPPYGYGYPPPTPPPKNPRRRLVWVLVGVGALVAALSCAGVVGLGFWGFNVIEVEIRNHVRDDPVVVQHIGEIESFEVNLTESAAVKDDDTFVYHVKGSKGSGVLTVRHVTDDNGDEVIQSAELRLPDGRVVKLESP